MAKPKLALKVPMAKRYVLLDKEGSYVDEQSTVLSWGDVRDTHHVEDYRLTSKFGYRVERLLDVIGTVGLVQDTFSSALAAPLFLDAMLQHLQTGETERGRYVEVDRRRFYEDGRGYHVSVRGVEGDETSPLTNVAVGALRFLLHVPTVSFLLFHNKDRVNPYYQLGHAEESKKGLRWVKDGVAMRREVALVNECVAQNLLTSYFVTYETLQPDVQLGLTYRPARKEKEA